MTPHPDAPPTEAAPQAELVDALAAPRLGLLLDFDGTLSDLVLQPSDARLRPAVLDALRALAATEATHVAVLSGRALGDLEGRVPVEGVWLVGGHGAELRRPDGGRELLVDAPDARQAVLDFVARTREAAGPGVIIEDKGLCAAVHVRGLRQAEARRVTAVATAIADELARAAPVRRTTGKAVVELLARGIDKGLAVRDLVQRWRPDACAAIGDDTTDEDMFRALEEPGGAPAAFTIKVGHERSLARHRLSSPREVERFLVDLARARACSRPART